MTTSQISFRVKPKIWQDFTDEANALFINRGPFLAHMLSVELPYLQEELMGLKLSLRAKRHISGALKKVVPLSPNVNIEVPTETADLLRTLVKKHNLVRDAFFYRLLVLLRGSDALLKYLEIPRYATDQGLNTFLEDMPSSPLKAMAAVRDNPLFYMRHHVEHVHGCGLYLVGLPFAEMHCYIEDEHVKGTKAHKRLAKLFELL